MCDFQQRRPARGRLSRTSPSRSAVEATPERLVNGDAEGIVATTPGQDWQDRRSRAAGEIHGHGASGHLPANGTQTPGPPDVAVSDERDDSALRAQG